MTKNKIKKMKKMRNKMKLRIFSLGSASQPGQPASQPASPPSQPASHPIAMEDKNENVKNSNVFIAF